MTVALNQVAKEAKLEEQILYACGLRSDEFSAYATHLESFQLIHSIFESSSQIDTSKQTPLIDVVKDYHCDWKELQGFIQPLLEDRYGLYVSKAFVNVFLSLEKSDLSLHQVFTELKTISEEGLRCLTNLIFASSLFPKVQNALLHESGGVGKKLSKLNQHLSTHDKAHASHLREAFDLDMAAKDFHSQSHEVVHHQSAHIDTHGRLDQDKRDPGIRSTQAMEGIRHTQLVHDDLNHGQVLIEAHSDISNHAGKAMDGITELPRLDLVGVKQAIHIATKNFSAPNLGATENLPLQKGGDKTLGNGEPRPLSTIVEVSELDDSIERLDPEIQKQLHELQSGYDTFRSDVSDIKDLVQALNSIDGFLASVPQDIRDLLVFAANSNPTLNLTFQGLRNVGAMFGRIEELTSQLSAENIEDKMDSINRVDEGLVSIDAVLRDCNEVVTLAKEHPNITETADHLATVTSLLTKIPSIESIQTSIKNIQEEISVIVDIQTLKEIRDFQVLYGEDLTSFTNWRNAHPGRIEEKITGGEADGILDSLTTLAQDSSTGIDGLEKKYRLAIESWIDGDLDTYLRLLINDRDELTALREKLSSFEGHAKGKSIVSDISRILGHQEKVIGYLTQLTSSNFNLEDFRIIMASIQQISSLIELAAKAPNYVFAEKTNEIITMLGYAQEFSALLANNKYNNLVPGIESSLQRYQEGFQLIHDEQQRVDQAIGQIVENIGPLELSMWARICDFFSSIWRMLTAW